MTTDTAGETRSASIAIQRFARFFKAYALGLSLVTASFPLVVGHWDLMPIFSSIKPYLVALTSLGAYLLVGVVFSLRRNIAAAYFPGLRSEKTWTATRRDVVRMRIFNVLPAVLTLLSFVLLFGYLWAVHDTVHRVAYEYAEHVVDAQPSRLLRQAIEPSSDAAAFVIGRLPKQDALIRISYQRWPDGRIRSYDVQFRTEDTVKAILRDSPSVSLPNLVPMMLSFLGAFLSAVGAFVLVGLKDYLQDVLGISEETFLSRRIVIE